MLQNENIGGAVQMGSLPNGGIVMPRSSGTNVNMREF